MSQTTSLCDSCHAGCCRSFAVPITGADVVRLERSTGLRFWDFACRWEDRQGHIAGDYVPHLYFDDEPTTPFTLCLMHQPSALFRETTKCRFLEESLPSASAPLGTGRCGVYSHRPSACQVFPLSLQKSSQLAVLDDVPAHGRPESGNDAYQLCPRPWEPEEIDPIHGPQQVAIAKFEADFFKVVASLWNERPSAWLKFPEFLRLVYTQRVVKVTNAGLEAEPPATIPMSSISDQRRAA